MLNTTWWDYSDRFLNLNGRISLIYSIFWGLLGVYLLRVVNPRIDEFIDWIKLKFNDKILKSLVVVVTILLLIDFIVSTFALDAYLTRTSIENDIEIENKEGTIKRYNYYYEENEWLSDVIYKLWGDKIMVKVYPNIKIRLADGKNILARDYHQDIVPYLYKFNWGIRNKD